MPILISFQEKKRRKYLIIIIVVAVLGIVTFLIYKHLSQEEISSPVAVAPKKEVKINFELFKNPTLVNLQPFEEITLPSPEADAVSLNPTLSWQSVPEAEIYLWEVVGVESGNTKETSATVSKRLEPSATYIWRVKACKEDMSECSLWSSRTFTTSPAFISPGLISPPMKEIFIKGREDPFKPY
jgi:hypothetical protein